MAAGNDRHVQLLAFIHLTDPYAVDAKLDLLAVSVAVSSQPQVQV